MKLLFLDVDGVLNKATTQGVFEDSCFDALRYIIENTGARIVLSSTWRYNEKSMSALALKLVDKNVIKDKDDAYLSITPNFSMIDGDPGLYWSRSNSHLTRTDEILLWLKMNTIPKLEEESEYFPLIPGLTEDIILTMNENWSNVGSWILDNPIEVDQFVILDDMALTRQSCYSKSIEKHFVLTSLITGLDQPDAEEAVNILNSSFNFSDWRKETFKSCCNPNCEAKHYKKEPKPHKKSKKLLFFDLRSVFI